jgi:hypothetical protein
MAVGAAWQVQQTEHLQHHVGIAIMKPTARSLVSLPCDTCSWYRHVLLVWLNACCAALLCAHYMVPALLPCVLFQGQHFGSSAQVQGCVWQEVKAVMYNTAVV